MFERIIAFFSRSAPSATPFGGGPEACRKLYRKLRFQSFLAGTLGYSLYYVCRTSLNVVKKPILESGALDATQLGMIGSALLLAYAVGKFVNGFLSDYSNIRRFMAAGLALSTAANLAVGLLGFANGAGRIGTGALLVCFVVLWGVNGWSQSMGAPPAIIALSRWYPLSKRGTYYGFFSASHNVGEFLSFLFVGLVVGLAGWQWGFIGSSVAGLAGVVAILCLMHDTPESKGLPPIGELTGELTGEQSAQGGPTDAEATARVQRAVVRNPWVWVLALASAFMYVSRYAVNGWGVLFLQEEKGFSLAAATQIISVNALLGIVGTVFSGWLSDKLFHGRRGMLAFLFGVCNTLGLVLFLYGGNGVAVHVAGMVIFGVAIGVLISFLGGLMAIDIVPREASGAALGIVGMASYVGAGLQDIVSGRLIEAGKLVSEGGVSYDFHVASLFWIASSVLSFLLVLLIWLRTGGAQPATDS
ncbi:MFS transporter [Alistipes sp.]|uniref:MFS transporter n=1 Tax=Alistipes sp. TaxID=1872444 RepID=UPI003AEFFD7A